MWRVIDAAQKRGWQYVVNFYGRRTGRSQYDIARFLCVLYVTSGAGFVTRYFRAESVSSGALLLVLMIGAAVSMWAGAAYDERAARRGKPGINWIAKDHAVSHFVRGAQTALLLLVVGTRLVANEIEPQDFSYIAMWGYWYVIICDPPPPPKEIVDNTVYNRAGA